MNFLRTHIRLIAFLSLVITSCKKEPLPVLPIENSPHYHVAGLVNEDSINWQVGVNNTWLNYGTSSLNGVTTYFGQINSSLNDEAIRIEIVQPEIYSDGTQISAITSTELEYLVHKSGSVKFNFGLAYEQFNYVLVKNENGAFEHLTSIQIPEFGVYCYKIRFSDYDDTKSFPFIVKYGFEDNALDLDFSTLASNNGVQVDANSTSGTHSWLINDSLVSQESSLFLELPDGIYTLTHDYTDAHGNNGIYSTLVRFKDGHFYWRMKYFYVSPNQPSSNFGHVIVSMKKNGEWYKSSSDLVNLEHFFHVSNIVTKLDGGSNSGRTAFDFEFRSLLFNASHSDSLYLPDMQGRIGVEFN